MFHLVLLVNCIIYVQHSTARIAEDVFNALVMEKLNQYFTAT
jgi:hypothetical protein